MKNYSVYESLIKMWLVKLDLPVEIRAKSTDIIRSTLRDEDHFGRITITIASSPNDENLHRYDSSANFSSPAEAKDSTPKYFAIAGVDTEYLTERRRSHDNLSKTKRVPP